MRSIIFISILWLTACDIPPDSYWKTEEKTIHIVETGACAGGGYSVLDGSQGGYAMIKGDDGEWYKVRCPVAVGMPMTFERSVRVSGDHVENYEWRLK